MTDSREISRSESPVTSQSKANDLRELVARLSDGVLTAQEASRLNALLKEDPIAQELYLDHMFVDGLLEREFGQTVPEISPTVVLSSLVKDEGRSGGAAREDVRLARRRSSLLRLRIVVPLFAMLVLGAVSGWLSWVVATPSFGDSQYKPLPLADPGFESGTPLPGVATVAGRWYGDVAEVVGLHSGISPLEGERMVRFVKSEFEPDDSCELYQLVDLKSMSDAIANGQVSVDASAFFNAVPHETWGNGYLFGVTLFAYAGEPEYLNVWPLREGQPLSFTGQLEPADTNVETWQPVRTRLTLPAGTTHLLVQVSIVRMKPSPVEGNAEFAGHFVDYVDLAMVTRKEQPRWVQALWRQTRSNSNQ